MCSLVGTNTWVNAEDDYKQYSNNLKEKDKKITRRIIPKQLEAIL